MIGRAGDTVSLEEANLAARQVGLTMLSTIQTHFGKEQCPTDLDTIADLQKVPSLLAQKGYTDSDIENIMSKNFIQFLRNTWK